MRPLSLHAKMTILISAITIAVMLATILLIGVRMTTLVRNDEQALAQFQAISLAEQISLMSSPRSSEDMMRAVRQARSARPNVIAVRLWSRSRDTLTEELTAGDTLTRTLPESARDALLRHRGFRSTDSPAGQTITVIDDAVCRVFAPVVENGRMSGAVEIVQNLDDVPSIVRQYAENAFGLAIVAVALSTLATWLSFRYFVYHPLEQLLRAITPDTGKPADGGTPNAAEDEFSRASQEYNRMLERVRTLTEERERRQDMLREMVREATEELQRRNVQLAEANGELWETSRRLSEMERLAAAGQTAAQFAHEVGTPLNTIGIHVELLRSSFGGDPEADKRTGIIAEQIDRIERIVRRMLDRTRTERSVLEPLDLQAVLNRICDTMEPAMEVHGVKLMKSIATALPQIAGDADRLQQVFINLVNNALDAMPDGGELRLTANEESGWVVVEFADTGCGMDQLTQAHIFDPLYTTKTRGTGLGLAIVGRIVEEHSGRVSVESTPGRGSRFRLSFPVAADESGGSVTRPASDAAQDRTL